MAPQQRVDIEHRGDEPARVAELRTAVVGGPGPTGRRLGQLLAAHGAITSEQLECALAEQTRTNDRLGTVLTRLGYISEEQLAHFLASVHGIPAVVLPDTVEPEVVALIPLRIARKYDVIPVERSNGLLTLAMADPTNLPALDDVAFMTGLRVVPAVAPLSAIRRSIEQSYEADGLTDAQAEVAELSVLDSDRRATPADLLELRSSADQAPVVRIVNLILLQAIRRAASDIHLEPSETTLRIRYRIDGMLHEWRALPKRLEPGIVSRLKIMANLDIAERRLPQDGRIKLHYNARQIDFRVSTIPVMFGESVSMRILDKDSLKLDLTQLGFDSRGFVELQKAIRSTHGMIVITGPTGSGKTTTLYSALHSLDSATLNIMTAEDPVEYNLERINQLAVNEEIGRSFAAALRSFLRHDPDVILVGEIRDLETAQIAVRAALTGHLVMSTLHTNDCASTIARLRDMNIAPFLIASSLRLVVAQRLARKVCRACREPYDVQEESLVPYGHTPQRDGTRTVYRGKGCRICSGTGMKGRIALYEIMPVTEEIRNLISHDAHIGQIRDVARRDGMRNLREAGLARVLDGVVSLDEALRVTSE